MNLIPLVVTVAAIILGSIFVDFEVGLLLGLIVGLAALQRETHLKIVALQKQIWEMSQPLVGSLREDSSRESKYDEPHPDPVEPRPYATQAAPPAAEPEPHATRAASIAAKPEKSRKRRPRK